MKRLVLRALLCAIVLLCACGGKEPEDTPAPPGNMKTSHEESAPPSDGELAGYETGTSFDYIGGYETEPLYQLISWVENCTDPEILREFLTDLYDEEISYVKLTWAGASECYQEPYQNYICLRTAYLSDALIGPLECDIWLFFKSQRQSPIFIMDSMGSYFVSKYEIHPYDDGTYGHLVYCWVSSELYLLSHCYVDFHGETRRYYDETSQEYRVVPESEFMARAANSAGTGFREYEALLSGYLDQTGQPGSGRDLPVTVEYVSDDNTDGLEVFAADTSEYRVDVLINAKITVTDFHLVRLNYQDGYAIAENLFSLGELTPERPLVAGLSFPGIISQFGITFSEPDGNIRAFAISQSGEDGSVFLEEFF